MNNIHADIVDLKPPNIEELAEVITCATFHTLSCNIFVYSTSRGSIKMADMRKNSLCDQHCKGEGSSSFFFVPCFSLVVFFFLCGWKTL